MTQSIFITGTDTGIGKTFVACTLIRRYIAQGYKVVGMKPVAAGCELVDGQWGNEDVMLLTEASNVKAPRELVNPYCFNPPIAPHIAAAQAGQTIDFEKIKQAYEELVTMADIVVVEGAGGLLVPLNDALTIADLIVALSLPAVLVVGLKLGCINHTLLTLEAISTRGIGLDGVILNQMSHVPNMLNMEQNIVSIEQWLQHRSISTSFEVLS